MRSEGRTVSDNNNEKFNQLPMPLPEEGLRLLRLFMSIKSEAERHQVLQMVEAYVKLLRQHDDD